MAWKLLPRGRRVVLIPDGASTPGGGTPGGGTTPPVPTTDPTIAARKMQLLDWSGGGITSSAWQGVGKPDYHPIATDVHVFTNIVWPDGSAGTFVATAVNTDLFEVDAYVLTHIPWGLKVTQPLIPRNTNGVPSSMPPLVVSTIS